VNDGTVVAKGSTQPLVVPLVVGGFPLPVTVHEPVVTFVHAGNALTQGVIAGVLDIDEAVASARTCAQHAATVFCGDAFNGIAEQIQYAQDILSDGSNAPGVPCDAISIGIGFSATLVANPTQVGTEPTPLPDPCGALPDASVDATGE